MKRYESWGSAYQNWQTIVAFVAVLVMLLVVEATEVLNLLRIPTNVFSVGEWSMAVALATGGLIRFLLSRKSVWISLEELIVGSIGLLGILATMMALMGYSQPLLLAVLYSGGFFAGGLAGTFVSVFTRWLWSQWPKNSRRLVKVLATAFVWIVVGVIICMWITDPHYVLWTIGIWLGITLTVEGIYLARGKTSQYPRWLSWFLLVLLRFLGAGAIGVTVWFVTHDIPLITEVPFGVLAGAYALGRLPETVRHGRTIDIALMIVIIVVATWETVLLGLVIIVLAAGVLFALEILGIMFYGIGYCLYREHSWKVREARQRLSGWFREEI